MATLSQTQSRNTSDQPPSQRAFHVRQAIIYGLLLFGAALVLIPFLWMISTSLKTQDQLFVRTIDFIPNPIVPGNYIEVWERLNSISPGMTIWRILGNTLFITVLAMFGEIFSASLVAYGFSRFKWKGRDALFALMLVTVMIPGIVTRVPGFLIWRQLGLLDTYDPLTWPSLFAWGPIYVFLMRQFFMSIPREIEEAAIIDGANTLQIYVYIMLPLIRPIMLAIAVLSFQGNWNNFQGPLLYLNTPERFPLALALRFFDQSLSREAPQWQYMMALATMMAAPVLAIYFLAQKQFLEGINVGGVKG
ncbi:MAG: carbohydrate ABC transporter permease [Pleurocapsa minor GSE-CHR-MK-17-07R]|jgi:multiple sugar transport system permease protein|nr:carbohydrate ABC transporter permease [Pleurocapsa minor GSE-CHR-MK 17-07R]